MRRITGILLVLVLIIPMSTNIKVISIKRRSFDKSVEAINNRDHIYASDLDVIIKNLDKDRDKIYDLLEETVPEDNGFIDVVVLLRDFSATSIKYFESLGGEIKKIYRNAIEGYSGRLPKKMLSELAKDPNIIFIQPNMKYKATMFNSLRLMGLKPYVWENYGYNGSSDMSIAIMDSGLDPSHISLSPYYGDANFSGKIVGWYDAVNGLSHPYDDNGHGTSIASVVGGNLVRYNETTIQFAQFAIVIDGLDAGYHEFFTIEVFPVFRTGDVSVIVKWKDVSIQPYSSKTHSAEVVRLIVYTPEGNTIITEDLRNPYVLSFKANVTGIYKLEIDLGLQSGGPYKEKTDGPGIAYWAFLKDNLSGSLTYGAFSGVAPEVKLVGVKVLDEEGYGNTEDILDGIEWVISNKEKYHIVAATITFGSIYVDAATEGAVKNLINNGIVVTVAAGNEGPGENTINSPARLEQVIAVGASTDAWLRLNITNWSSRGPYSKYPDGSPAETNVTKPDIVAPGGDFDEPAIICADDDRDDNLDLYIWDYSTGAEEVTRLTGINDIYGDDLIIVRGTSVSAAQVGGAVAIVVQAITHDDWSNWNYTIDDVLKVKHLLLMTAWEIYRGPEVGMKANRGQKDYVEGYGLVQVDAAIEALENVIDVGNSYRVNLTSRAFGKHVWAGKVYFKKGKNYIFRVEVPDFADFDLYIWSGKPDKYGEPVLLTKSIHGMGMDEYVVFTPPENGFYYVTVKEIFGSGEFKFNVAEVYNEALRSIHITPNKGSIVDSPKQKLRVTVEVENTYVEETMITLGNKNISMVQVWVSEDGRKSTWEANITFQLFSANAKIIIDTPLKIFTIEYSLIVIPYYQYIIGASIIIAAGLASYKGYKIYLKKKEERLMMVEEEAKKISEEIIEEVLEEEE